MTKADLIRKWAWVHDVCKGTPMEGKERQCVKLSGVVLTHRDPDFTASPKEYEFMLGLLEGRPLFDGDLAWYEEWGQYLKIHGDWSKMDIDKYLSWEEPKRQPADVIPKPAVSSIHNKEGRDGNTITLSFSFPKEDSEQAKKVMKRLYHKISSGS